MHSFVVYLNWLFHVFYVIENEWIIDTRGYFVIRLSGITQELDVLVMMVLMMRKSSDFRP